MRLLVGTHRWLGIVLAPCLRVVCEGIVMHFVPFATERKRAPEWLSPSTREPLHAPATPSSRSA